ncbi:MAG: BsuPI-related putative proteinase inhibitor [Gemmatimonadaceae bacterium]
MRFHRLSLGVLLAFSAACSSERATEPVAKDSDEAAASFDAVASGLEQSGDAERAAPFRDAADITRAAARLTKISLVIDEVSTDFYAVGQRTILPSAVPCVDSGSTAVGVSPASPRGTLPPLPIYSCLRLAFRPNLIAWQASAPYRLLTVSGDEGALAFGPGPDPRVGSPVVFRSGMATLFDKNGGFWYAATGTGEDHLVRTTGACAPTPIASSAALGADCQRALFSWSLNLSMLPIPVVGSPPPARPFTVGGGSPHIVLSPTEIAGTVVRVTRLPPPPPPPVAGDLAASLVASVASDSVVFLLTVANATDHVVEIKFGSGQTYDFVVREASSGRTVWRWSDGKAFTLALGSRLLPPRESITYSAPWRPVGLHGKFVAEGMQTSYSQPVGARAELTLR